MLWTADGTILLFCQRNKVSHLPVMFPRTYSVYFGDKQMPHRSTHFFHPGHETLPALVFSLFISVETFMCLLSSAVCRLIFDFMEDRVVAAWKEKHVLCCLCVKTAISPLFQFTCSEEEVKIKLIKV